MFAKSIEPTTIVLSNSCRMYNCSNLFLTIIPCSIASKSEIEFTPELEEIIDTPHSLHPGGLTGAGAKITGAVGDVFAKLTFDEQFQDKRQQQKTRPPKLGSKLGGFAKVHTHTYIIIYL